MPASILDSATRASSDRGALSSRDPSRTTTPDRDRQRSSAARLAALGWAASYTRGAQSSAMHRHMRRWKSERPI
eukprot:4980133-Alexandrium_andersonii.AAC.1